MFEKNAESKGALNEEVRHALFIRSAELGRELIVRKTGLKLDNLLPSEIKIVEAISAYVAIKKLQGKGAEYTFRQIKNRGLRGAVESAVCHHKQTKGFKTLYEVDRSEISYEQIVLDHPDDFTERALWFAKTRLFGLDKCSPAPPAISESITQKRTVNLLAWLKNSARVSNGCLSPYSNEEAAARLDLLDMKKYGKVFGNIQSRIDFACYRAGLPPLGLVAVKPFDKAWGQDDRDWPFPIESMRRAAREQKWRDTDFNAILSETEKMSGQAHLEWGDALLKQEKEIKAWAYGLGSENLDGSIYLKVEVNDQRGEVSAQSCNPNWMRDELILALDLYMKHRLALPGKSSKEVEELSMMLNSLGKVLGQNKGKTYRNPNGVYMKLMNFRSHDPNYTADGRVGLDRGNKDEALVWSEFASNPERLGSVAKFIRDGVAAYSDNEDLSGPDELDIVEAEEGKVATRIHRYRERNRKLVETAKEKELAKSGRLSCQVCGFDFTKQYGEAGRGVIDVHHTKPVHTMQPGEKTKVNELVLLCPNCHRMVHSKRKWLSIEELKQLLQ